MTNKWRLYSLEAPEDKGIYEVRLGKKDDHLSSDIETIMEFNGRDWLLRVPTFINEYRVIAWRNLE